MFRSFAAAKSCHERLQERQPNGAHSFYALFQQVFGRGTFQTDFSWCVDRQDKPTDSARHTRKSRAHLWLPAWWLDWSLVAGLSWHCPHNDVGALYRLFFGGCISPYFTWEFSEGRKSMATQWTHRELAPRYAAGKSPCLGAESATGRPEDRDTRAISEAQVELWFWCFGPLQQQSHAMSVCKNANRTGLTLSMPSSNRCLAEARFKQIFLDASIGKTNQQTVQDTRGKAGRTCGCPHDG